jgi:hypothetical protein
MFEDFNSDYDTLLLKSGLPSLKIRRLRMMAIEIFKILHKKSPAYLNDIVSFKHISATSVWVAIPVVDQTFNLVKVRLRTDRVRQLIPECTPAYLIECRPKFAVLTYGISTVVSLLVKFLSA